MRRSPPYGLFLVFCCVIAAVGCGGGGGGGGTSLPSTGSGGAPGGSTSTPQTSYSTSVTLSTTSTTPVSLHTLASGVGGSITLPVASSAATANLTFESTLPSGVSMPMSIANEKSAQSIGGSNLTLITVVALTVNSSVTVTSSPAFSFSVPSAIGGDAYIAYFDANNSAAGWTTLLGPGTVSGNSISFPAQSITPPVTFLPSDTYVFVLVASSTPANSPSLTYSGTKTTSYAYGFGFGYPTTPPTPMPTSIAAAATVVVSVGATPYPSVAPTPGLVDLHVVESDAASLSTSTYTTDSWIGLTSGSSMPYLTQTYASVQQEPSSDALPLFTTLYGSPQITDQYPQTGGASWSNSPAANITYSYSDGDSGTRVVASSGSYTDTENLLAGGAGGQATLSENSNGSGSIAGPFFSGGIISSIVFSANSGSTCNPVNSSGPPVPPPCLTATTTYTPGAISFYGISSPVTVPDATWYSLPLALYMETDAISAGASLPGSCTPNSYGTTANDVRRTITTVDTVIGFVETTVLDSYELDGQPICLVSSDTQNYAYDEQGNTPYLLLVGSLGLETIATTESLILQPGAALVLSTRRTAASLGAPVSNSIGAALQAHELLHLAHDRALRTRDLVRTMRSHTVSPLRVIGGAAQ